MPVAPLAASILTRFEFLAICPAKARPPRGGSGDIGNASSIKPVVIGADARGCERNGILLPEPNATADVSATLPSPRRHQVQRFRVRFLGCQHRSQGKPSRPTVSGTQRRNSDAGSGGDFYSCLTSKSANSIQFGGDFAGPYVGRMTPFSDRLHAWTGQLFWFAPSSE